MSTVIFDPIKHEYRNTQGNIVPSVTWILAQSGLCDFSFVEAEIRDRAMERGKSVHWMLQLEDQGALDYRRVPLRLRPYRQAYLLWKKASGFVPEWIERSFISHYGYAGTLDRYGTLPATTMIPVETQAVVDFKTTVGDVPNHTRFQLVAYAMRTHAHPGIARRCRRIGLALHPNGTYGVKEFPVSTWDRDWAIFIQAKRRVDAGHVERIRD